MLKLDADLAAALRSALAPSMDALRQYVWLLPAFVAIAVACFCFERRFRGLSVKAALRSAFPPEVYRHRATRFDMIHMVLRLALWTPLIRAGGTVIGTAAVYDALAGQWGEMAPLVQSPWIVIPAHFVLIFLTLEFGSYVLHFAFHKVPWLWSFHRLHHSTEAFTLFSEGRSHPVESAIMFFALPVITGVLTGTVLYLSGTPLDATAMAAFAAFNGVWGPINGLLRHSHLPISFGWLDAFVAPPIAHQLHHSAERRHFDKNLGGWLPLFDQLFGTWYLPASDEAFRCGLNEREFGETNPHNNLRGYYLEPFQHAWRVVTKRRGPDKRDAGLLCERPSV